MLGHLYAAEALVLLDKISDAIGHLNLEHVKDLTLIVPSAEKDLDREKADMGTEQHKPLKVEAESNEHYQAVHRVRSIAQEGCTHYFLFLIYKTNIFIKLLKLI
jgi:hypothetical protein